MRFAAIWLVMLLTVSSARADVKFFASPSEIVAQLMSKKPRVVAFGEYHQIEGGAKVPSAVKRFGDQMLQAIAPATSDLIVETWVTEGKCGETETKAVAKVEETIKRPEATEDELVTLLRRAKTAGVRPHILTLSCAEYEDIQPKDGEVDYVKLLGVVTAQLKKNIDASLKVAPKGKTVAVYGGALHNDVYPKKILAQFSFAKPVAKEVGGKYLEVDLYVPEYIAGDKDIVAERWFSEWKKLEPSHPGEAALVARGPSSYIVIFPMTRNGSNPPSDPTAAPKQP